MILPGVPRDQRISFSGRMIKLFLELGFKDELPELTDELMDSIDEIVGKAMETAEGASCSVAPGGC